ncbi:MAG: TonB-dependent receptor, partial [Candidatus Aminicenantes bacterium]
SDYLDSVEQKYHGTFGAGFLTYIVYPFSNFSLSSGVRLDYVPLSERTHISPRFSFSWALTKRLSVNGAYGMFYQQMPLFLIKQHPDNVKLKDPQTRHLVLGFKYLLRPDTQLKLEAYDKQYHHFPISPINPYVFIIDDVNGDYDKFMNWGNFVDTGKAYARGVELTLRKKLSKKFYGILNLTYYRARYQDLTGVWRNRIFDNRFIVCLSGGYKPTKNWEFNAQWIWSGNQAFSPVNEEKSKELGLPYVESKDILSAYLSDYQNLSIRVDRRFFFSKSNLVIFIGALNVLNHKNEIMRNWDTWDNRYVSEYMWGIIPYIGLEFEF